jgi:hypothetical protein
VEEEVRESTIEAYFRKLVLAHGGRCYKWVSPGEPGVPDRIVFFPGSVFLVELKQTRGRMRGAQDCQHRRLRKLGFDVIVLRSKEAVKLWVELQVSALKVVAVNVVPEWAQ